MPLLPVSGTEFALHGVDGSGEMAVLEAVGDEMTSALVLLSRTAALAGEPASDASLRALTVTDFEYLLLSMRASWFGPQLTLGLACAACRDLAQLSVGVSELLAQATPTAPRGVAPHASRPAWFILEGVAFRLPTVGDLIATAGEARPVKALAALTIGEGNASGRVRARVERAMAAMAPQLSRSISGPCPNCRAPLVAFLSVAATVLAELRLRAAYLHDDVDLIARHYHWPQDEILSLPLSRRSAYVDRIRRALTQAA